VGLPLDRDVPPPGPFPQLGSLEAVAAGHALDGLAREASATHPDSELAKRLSGAGAGAVLGAEAVAAAQQGDPAARATVQLWAHRVGIGIANAINTFDPDEVVIGGGAVAAGELLLGPASEVAQGYVVPGLKGRTTVRLARHGVRAGVLGAALLAAHELEQPTGPVLTSPTSTEAS